MSSVGDSLMLLVLVVCRSLLYGFANGDILFDEALPITLQDVFDDTVKRYSELLITGVRTDCVVDVDPDCRNVFDETSQYVVQKPNYGLETTSRTRPI